MVHPNVELLRREAEQAFQREFYKQDHVLHYSGKNPFAGDHHGHDGLAGLKEALGSVFSSVERELIEVMANDQKGIQVVDVKAERADGRRHEWRVAWIFDFRDGRISESWAVLDDQEALDRFLGD